MGTSITVGVLAFLGGGLGSLLTYLGGARATRARSEESRRAEWGRRFTAALAALTSADGTARATGRALLVELMRSGLATADDRREAAAVLDAAATHHRGGDLRLVLPAHLDDVEIVGDTRQEHEEEQP